MELMSNNSRIIKTFNLYALFLVLGMCLVMIGPTLIDLMHIVQSDIKNMAYIFPAKSIGLIIGSTTGGFVFDMIAKKQILFVVYSLILSIATFGIPWSRNIVTLFVWISLQGLSIGSLLNGGNVFCLQLWGKKNAPFFQALYFLRGVGGLVGPLLATPFISNYHDIEKNRNNTLALNQSYISSNTLSRFQNSTSIFTTLPPVTFVYILLAALTFIVTIMHFVSCIVVPEDKTRQMSKTPINESIKLRSNNFLVLLLCILTFCSYGNQVGYNQMLIIYGLKTPLQLSSIIGSYMISVFFAAITISRLFAIFLTIKIGNLALIIINLIFLLVGSMILLFFSAYYEWALWLSTVLLGVGLAPLVPACTTWVERYITITHKVVAFFSFSTGISTMLVPFVISCYIEENPYFFTYVIALNSACIIAIVIILFVSLKNLPDKYKIQQTIIAPICNANTKL